MATGTATTTIGPRDHGREMAFDDFIAAEGTGGYLYELARGVVVVTNVPGIHHGWIVERISELFVVYKLANPGIITYRAAGSDARIRLRGMRSDRHPDQAVYLDQPPTGPRTRERWVPAIVVEVVSRRGEHRDYVEKREEYLRFGVREYWIFDPIRRVLLVQKRAGDAWEDRDLRDHEVYATDLLPGLEVAVGAILGPAVAVEEMDEVELTDDDLGK